MLCGCSSIGTAGSKAVPDAVIRNPMQACSPSTCGTGLPPPNMPECPGNAGPPDTSPPRPCYTVQGTGQGQSGLYHYWYLNNYGP